MTTLRDSEENLAVEDADRLFDEAGAIIQCLDELEKRESNVETRTMGSMAYSSYREDQFHLALQKIREGSRIMDDLDKRVDIPK